MVGPVQDVVKHWTDPITYPPLYDDYVVVDEASSEEDPEPASTIVPATPQPPEFVDLVEGEEADEDGEEAEEEEAEGEEGGEEAEEEGEEEEDQVGVEENDSSPDASFSSSSSRSSASTNGSLQRGDSANKVQELPVNDLFAAKEPLTVGDIPTTIDISSSSEQDDTVNSHQDLDVDPPALGRIIVISLHSFSLSP